MRSTVNQQLLPKPASTQPRWVAVSTRSLNTLPSTSQLFAMDLIKTMVRAANEELRFEAELHFVAIPADAPNKTTKEMFDKQYMLALHDLGRLMGADPASWADDIPSAYGVEETWLDSD